MGDRHMVGNDVVTNNGILRLVINLDRSPERMRSISQQLVVRDLHFERLKRNFPGWKLPMTLPRSLSSEGVVAKWKSVFFVAYGLLEEARQKRL